MWETTEWRLSLVSISRPKLQPEAQGEPRAWVLLQPSSAVHSLRAELIPQLLAAQREVAGPCDTTRGYWKLLTGQTLWRPIQEMSPFSTMGSSWPWQRLVRDESQNSCQPYPGIFPRFHGANQSHHVQHCLLLWKPPPEQCGENDGLVQEILYK